MKIEISFSGLDELIRALDPEQAKANARQAVKRHAALMQQGAVRRVPVDTGHLKRSIMPPEISSDGLTATVRATAEYAAYVELGTRFMRAQPYLSPAFNEVLDGFLADVRKGMIGK